MNSNRTKEFLPLSFTQRLVVVTSILYSTGYFIWRARETVNTENYPAYSWIFYAFDLFGFISSLFFMAATWRIRNRQSAPAKKQHSVDVFIPTINEAPELLRMTIYHALKMEYPHETYVLDDGNRPEIKALAESMGAKYISRDKGKGAKAGNINNAMSLTKGDLIAIFDADGIARRDFLTRTLGYFDDDKIALVQTPNAFYNLDSFQHWTENSGKSAWNEQTLWYDVIQRGLDFGDAAVWCGSGSLVRRSSLESIGGISTESVTEDTLTTLKLHKAGFGTVYHDEPISFNLAPTSLEPYLVQRGRWAMGSIQILRKQFLNLVRPSALTFHRRIAYLMTLYYFTSIQKLLYYVAPFLYLVFGIAPVIEPGQLILPLLGYVVLSSSAFLVLSRGSGRIFRGEVYFLHLVPVYMKAIFLGLLPFFKGKFKVTSKDPNASMPLKLRITPFIVTLMCTWGIGAGIYNYAMSGELDMGTLLTLCVAGYYLFVGVSALTTMGKTPHSQETYTFYDYRPVQITSVNGIEQMRNSSLGIAFSISDMSVQLVHMQSLHTGAEVHFNLDLPNLSLPLHGKVQRCEAWVVRGLDPLFIVELKLEEMTQELRDMLNNYFFEDATPKAMETTARIVREPQPKFHKENLRKNKRLTTLLPVIVEESGQTHQQFGLLVDVSNGGARVKFPTAIEVGSQVQIQMPWIKKTAIAKVARCQKEGDHLHSPHDVGLSFSQEVQMEINSLSAFNRYKSAVG